MRRFLERFVQSLHLDPRSRRVLDETFNDWRHEDASVNGLWQQWTNDLRSAWSVVRAIVLVSWWKPHMPIAQTTGPGAISARDEMINVLNGLPPEASYEQILEELAALRAAKGDTGGGGGKSRRLDPAFWFRAVRTTALFLVITAIAAALQTYTTTPIYRGVAKVRVDPEGPPISAVQQAQQMLQSADPAAFMLTELSIIKSSELKRRVVRKLGLDKGRDESLAMDELSSKLRIALDQASHLFTISYSASSPQLVASVANAIAEEYVAQNLARRKRHIDGQLAKISEMLNATKINVEEAQKVLAQRTSAFNLIDPQIMAANVAAAMTDYNAKAAAADEARIVAAEMAAPDLSTPKGLENALSHPELYRDAAPYRAEISRINGELLRFTNARLGESHPSMQDARRRLEKAQGELKAALQLRIDAAKKAFTTAEAQRLQAEQALKTQQDLSARNARNGMPLQVLRGNSAPTPRTISPCSRRRTNWNCWREA